VRPGQIILSCDPVFVTHTNHWLIDSGETLDAVSAAVESVLLVAHQNKQAIDDYLKEKQRQSIFSFLAKHFDPQLCVFRNNGSDTAGIYATHAAMGIMKALRNRNWKAPLTEGNYREDIQRICEILHVNLTGDPIEALRKFVTASCAASPMPGGICDNPQSTLPSLTTLSTASSIVWNLYDKRAATEFFTIVGSNDDTRAFILACLKRYPISDFAVTGFTVRPDVEELCINTTCFGLNLLRRLEWYDSIINSSTREQIINFYHLCFKGCGFSTTPLEPPSLNATWFALRSLRLLDEDEFHRLLNAHADRILEFADSCTNALNGGAAFNNHLDKYVENCLATRYAAQIYDLMRETPGPSVRDKPAVSSWSAGALEFCTSQYNPETGGYCNYALGRIGKEAANGSEQVVILSPKSDPSAMEEEEAAKLAQYFTEWSKKLNLAVSPNEVREDVLASLRSDYLEQSVLSIIKEAVRHGYALDNPDLCNAIGRLGQQIVRSGDLYYRTHKDELIKKHHDRYIALLGDEVLAEGRSAMELLDEIDIKVGYIPVLIRQACEGPLKKRVITAYPG
jgi:hypothetical protein